MTVFCAYYWMESSDAAVGMLKGMSLKQLKADISRNIGITQGQVLGLQKVDPKTSHHVTKQFHSGLTPPKHGTLQPWAWASFRQETGSQSPDCPSDLPTPGAPMMGGAGPKHPATGAQSLSAAHSQRVWEPLPLRMGQKPCHGFFTV